MTYAEAVAYLESLVDFEKLGFRRHFADTVSLDTIRALLENLGQPQRGLPCVHIAGTKGKGSTGAILESILAAAGYNVGLFTSPHLVSFRERIRIGQQMASENDIIWAVERVQPAIESLRRNAMLNPSTFFEAYTAMAYLLFRKYNVDVAIMEAGLGGRLDATNTCEPLACAITTLGMDHTEILGDTIEQIAREKAGILKPGVSAVLAPQAPPAEAVLRDVGNSVGAPVRSAPAVTSCPQPPWMHVTAELSSGPLSVQLALFGEHQAINCSVALGLVEILKEQGYLISEEAIIQGCRDVVWPGRLQIFSRSPWIVLDVAHNEAAAQALVRALPQMLSYERLIAVIGISAEKDATAFCRVLAPYVDVAILTQAQISRALAAEKLAEASRGFWRQFLIASDVSLALSGARAQASPQDCILITGSFYIVGEALELLSRAKLP